MVVVRRHIRVGNSSVMVSGGVGRRGPYAYVGVRHAPSGAYAGASVGSEGRNVYGGIDNRHIRARVKYNVESNTIRPRLKLRRIS